MRVVHLGRLGYRAAWDRQIEAWDEVAGGAEDTLLLVEHDPVFTLGAGFQADNLLLPREEYGRRGYDVVETDRGGDVTFHGPGQLVAYPVFDLRRHGSDVRAWLRGLEEAVIVALRQFGVEGRRIAPHTGVWVGPADRPAKVAAIGVKVRRWVSLHGIALNCDNDLAPFSLIVPCGIVAHPVTSLSAAGGREVGPEDAAPALVEGFVEAFGP